MSEKTQFCEGRIESIKDNQAFVILNKEEDCSNCNICNIFGKDKSVIANPSVPCVPGDRVLIKILPFNNTLRNAILVFGMPLILFAGGFIVYSQLSAKPNELTGAGIGFTLLVIWFFILKKIDTHIGKKQKPRVFIVKVINNQ